MARDKELSPFEINLVHTMTHLYSHDAVDDEIMHILRDIEMDYQSLLQKYRLLEERVNLDEKTNLLKYRDDYITSIVKSASRVLDRMPGGAFHVSYIRFDIDDFSFVNNRYGHDKGDLVLVGLADLLKKTSRPTDYVIRFGGEEFDVILPSTDTRGAVRYLDKIYHNINTMMYHFDKDPVHVTASAGVSSYEIPHERMREFDDSDIQSELFELQNYADDALYEAKLAGKNQYRIFDPCRDYGTVRRQYSTMKHVIRDEPSLQ